MWKGWTKEDATWEPEEHLDNVQYMIDEFNRKIEARHKSSPVAVLNANQRKQAEEITHQELKNTNTAQRTTRKTLKESDSDIQV